jgi:soluble lytic murein transglycosylase-like protein
MQLMPSTADDLGVSDVCDPAQNIDGGVRLLRSLLDTYRNPLIAAAAYNAGEANVRRYGGIPPFPETVRFVAEVINRELGLPAPMTGGTKARPPTGATDGDVLASPTPIGGTSRQWVRGVMQF